MSRSTVQRAAIWSAFQRAHRPLSAEEVRDLASEEVSGLGIATVYRQIRSLVAEGKISTVKLVGAPDRYGLCLHRDHSHFHCDDCDRVFDLGGALPSFKSLMPRGYKLRHVHVVLEGQCAECRSHR